MVKEKENPKDNADKQIVVSRLINAPREMVYRACIEPQQMAQWWGPFGFTNPACELDVRVGGKWHIDQIDAAGNLHKFHGEYLEVVPNERLVWTFVWGGAPTDKSINIMTFEKKDDKTLLTSTTVLDSPEQRNNMMKFGADMGGKQSYEKLEEYLTNEYKGRELTVVRILKAPRELVFKLWTDPEHIKHWWGPNGFNITTHKMDAHEGGEWQLTMHGPDGTDYPNKHIYLEVVKNERIVMQHTVEALFKMIVEFIPLGDQTLLSIRSQFQSAEQMQEIIRKYKAEEGLKQNVERLETYISQISPAISDHIRQPK